MTHANWPGLRSTTFDPAPHPFDLDGAGALPQRAAGTPYAADAIASSWWARPPAAGTVDAGAFAGLGGGIFSFVQSIVAMIVQLGTALLGRDREAARESGPQRAFSDVELSSTGDPHIAETGTYADGTQANARFDSMSAHDDLLHAASVDGGYRVSTTVTQPSADGRTWNGSATVHAAGDQDTVTMHADGAISVVDGGDAVTIAKGQTLTLSGGETVTENADGSLVVAARDADGGTIATTMRTNVFGVDVTTQAHGIAVGGDIVNGSAA